MQTGKTDNSPIPRTEGAPDDVSHDASGAAPKDAPSDAPEDADAADGAPAPADGESTLAGGESTSDDPAEAPEERGDATFEDDEDAASGDAPRGVQVIRGVWQTLPNQPGVYRMYDARGDCLYVGKARDLKKRVIAYTKLMGHPNRIARMIATTASMEIVTTATETEALLLEANLIKRLKPRYNVLLRDDKSFPHILVRMDHEAPQILKHRGAQRRDGHYFGPFASAGAVNRTLDALQKVFLLRSCSDSVYDSRTRPCLLYQIKRCSAPCTGEIAPEDYAGLVDQAVGFLNGKSRHMQETLQKQMAEASENLDFERAAAFRDRIRALAMVQAHQGINPSTVEEADVFAVHGEGGQTCVQVFFFRAGQNWGNRAYFPRHDKAEDLADVLDAFLAQFYDNKTPPRLILLSHDIPNKDLLSEALGVKAERKVQVHVPERGEKRELVDHARTNAKDALGRRLAETSTQAKLLRGVADAFGMDEPPERIEVYDNSHIQGTNAVGAMIVAGPEGFQKNSYRKFNIKGEKVTPGDDYAMMREVFSRRFSRLLKERSEDGTKGEGWPDLVLVDGGQGQLASAWEVLDELGIDDLCVVGVAKGPDRDAGRETFFMRGAPSFRLPPQSPVLYYLQRLRDEAHRFAIGTHRAKRSKDIQANPLDGIAGIGARRKKALLNHFGSAKAVSRAGLADLEAVEGISKAMARKIHDHFRD